MEESKATWWWCMRIERVDQCVDDAEGCLRRAAIDPVCRGVVEWRRIGLDGCGGHQTSKRRKRVAGGHPFITHRAVTAADRNGSNRNTAAGMTNRLARCMVKCFGIDWKSLQAIRSHSVHPIQFARPRRWLLARRRADLHTSIIHAHRHTSSFSFCFQSHAALHKPHPTISINRRPALRFGRLIRGAAPILYPIPTRDKRGEHSIELPGCLCEIGEQNRGKCRLCFAGLVVRCVSKTHADGADTSDRWSAG